jgi:hypothetical protein
MQLVQYTDLLESWSWTPFVHRKTAFRCKASGDINNTTNPIAIDPLLGHDTDTAQNRNLDSKLQIPSTFMQSESLAKKDRVGFPTHRPAFPPHFETITTMFTSKPSAI